MILRISIPTGSELTDEQADSLIAKMAESNEVRRDDLTVIFEASSVAPPGNVYATLELPPGRDR